MNAFGARSEPAPRPMPVSPARVWAVLLQELYITRRSVEVIVDLPFWSIVTVVVFGFTTRFLATVMDPTVAQYLYLGMLLYEIIRITQYSMSLGALWNVWSRNYNNMFITPLSMQEYVLAQMVSGLIKAALLFGVVALVAATAFDFDITRIGMMNLVLVFANLVCFAYSLGLVVLGIIFRLGTRIQALAWGLVMIFQPLCAAFYPLRVLPPALQGVALAFPPTYAFEAARTALPTSETQWAAMGIASVENAFYFLLSVWFFSWMYRRSRETGQFARNEE